MADQASISITFLTFIALFIGVGLYSSTQKQNTTTDYLLAGRGINPWLMALSTVATVNSGFKFIGLVGFTYEVGLSASWFTIGFVIGDGLAWLTVHRRLRQISEDYKSETIPGFLGQRITPTQATASENASKRASKQELEQESKQESSSQPEQTLTPPLPSDRGITIATAIVTLIFLSLYAAAQLHAGSKALSVVFGWDSWAGITFGAVVVGIYCVSGGIRASIWVGSIQAILMMVSTLALLGVAIAACGGPSGLWHQLNLIDPSLTNIIPSYPRFGVWPFAIAWTVSGFGVIGQPHMMIRAMAIESGEKIRDARNLYMAFNIIFCTVATAIGLTARVLLPDLLGTDTELALPQLAATLLPGALVGLVLVGLFSATISTADAQILSCSAALTQDLRPQEWIPNWISNALPSSPDLAKVGTLTMVSITLVMALTLTNSVFFLVTFAWAALASSLGPLMLIRVLKRPLNTPVAVTMIVTGIGTAFIWRLGFNLSQDIYEVLPSMLASIMVYILLNPFVRSST